MVKISASISKKVPMPGIEFSSQQFGAALEVEVSDADKPEVIKERLKALYGLLNQTIDEQIGAAAKSNGNGNGGVGARPAAAPANVAQPAAPASNVGALRFIPATAAQQKAILAICKDHGMDVGAVLGEHGVQSMERLGLKQASKVIDALKARKNR